MFFALTNLCSSAVEPCPTPWTYAAQAPEEVKGKEGKKERDKWANTPSTRHSFFSGFEGVNPSVRVSEPKAGEEGNPPFKMHAFVVDFDTAVSVEELAAGIARVSLKPNYYGRSLSGHAHMIWLFERPISFPNTRFAVEFLKLALQKTHFESIAAALDRPAWESPNRYFTNGCDWYCIDADARVPHSLLQGWILEVSERHVWRKDRGAVDIPLPVVWLELQKKYPGCSAWTNEFVEGAQGPSFWIEGSGSPKSAIVKPTGIFTFAAHAIKPFYSWADLLGKDFVDRYSAEMLGKAVEDIYHDGKQYYRKDGYGVWRPYAKEDVLGHLSTDRGLSTVKDGGSPSEVNRAIQYVQNWQAIDGAAPFVFQRPGILTRQGAKLLNTHTRRVISPAPGPIVWGPLGQFPFLSRFFVGFFHQDSKPSDPKTFYLSWLAHFYRGAYELNPSSGQCVVILGKAGVGKTFLNQGILPLLFGGAAEAQAYLMGDTDFNSQLFEVGVWTVDDNSVTVDVIRIRKYSAMMKKMSANTTFEYHAKFRVPCAVEWLGRVQVTANDDEESARIVPDLSISNLDKISLYRTAEKAPVGFPNRRECERIIREEAPYFARWLLDFKIPTYILGDSRFGVRPYHEESLIQVAEQSSRTASFLEIVEDWRAEYFSDYPDRKVWEGSSFQFLKALHGGDTKRGEAGLRGVSSNFVAAQLSALKAKGCTWIAACSNGTTRLWTILRPDSAKTAELPTGDKFAKAKT